MQEIIHNVEAAVDGGVNDLSTNKCKVIFIFVLFIYILEFSCAPMCLTCSFFYPTPLVVWFNSFCLLLLIIALFFCFFTMSQGPVVGNKPCSTIGDVPLNVSSSMIGDVAVDASKVCFSVLSLILYAVFAAVSL